jgi:hypothetical protein
MSPCAGKDTVAMVTVNKHVSVRTSIGTDVQECWDLTEFANIAALQSFTMRLYYTYQTILFINAITNHFSNLADFALSITSAPILATLKKLKLPLILRVQFIWRQ